MIPQSLAMLLVPKRSKVPFESMLSDEVSLVSTNRKLEGGTRATTSGGGVGVGVALGDGLADGSGELVGLGLALGLGLVDGGGADPLTNGWG